MLAERAIGNGKVGLATFPNMMGMLPPITQPPTLNTHTKKVRDSTEVEKQINLSAAAENLFKGAMGDVYRYEGDM